MIRVGRCTYENGVRKDPTYPGFKPILVMMKSHSKWYPLSPYELKDDQGRILENIWQFSKVYKTVPRSKQHKSQYDRTLIWEWPQERHVDENGEVNENYWKWRESGMNNQYPVRYPVGFDHRHLVLYSLEHINGDKLNYIEARKKIYVKKYCDLVRKVPEFDQLLEMLKNGENLLIISNEGPHEDSLLYYMEHYGVNKRFIERNSILSTPDNLRIMINDEKHPFGYGYCLAIELSFALEQFNLHIKIQK